jgi:hypothetical protein
MFDSAHGLRIQTKTGHRNFSSARNGVNLYRAWKKPLLAESVARLREMARSHRQQEQYCASFQGCYQSADALASPPGVRPHKPACGSMIRGESMRHAWQITSGCNQGTLGKSAADRGN